MRRRIRCRHEERIGGGPQRLSRERARRVGRGGDDRGGGAAVRDTFNRNKRRTGGGGGSPRRKKNGHPSLTT